MAAWADWGALVTTYGYAAVFAGTFVEGETVLLLAGYLAHRGYLSLPLVMLCALAGSVAGDQFFFLLGRLRGRPLLLRRPGWAARAAAVDRRLHRHRRAVLLSFRFLYGLRMLTPFVVGMGRMPARTFAVYNVLGALAWSAAVSGAGYLFGSTLELLFARAERYEHWAVAGLAGAGLAAWGVHLLLRRRRGGPDCPDCPDGPDGSDEGTR
jgi:membrane protein DedA with SNARE-associated domain